MVHLLHQSILCAYEITGCLIPPPVTVVCVSDWPEALLSFTRCCQQDMEIGEAWANIGAIHMRRKEFPKAVTAMQEALKHKPRNWKILENLMILSLQLER